MGRRQPVSVCHFCDRVIGTQQGGKLRYHRGVEGPWTLCAGSNLTRDDGIALFDEIAAIVTAHPPKRSGGKERT